MREPAFFIDVTVANTLSNSYGGPQNGSWLVYMRDVMVSLHTSYAGCRIRRLHLVCLLYWAVGVVRRKEKGNRRQQHNAGVACDSATIRIGCLAELSGRHSSTSM